MRSVYDTLPSAHAADSGTDAALATRHSAFFVAPQDGTYTLLADFGGGQGELWLSPDANPAHAELAIDSTVPARTPGWFGPAWPASQMHFSVKAAAAWAGPLMATLLGTSAKSDELLLTRGAGRSFESSPPVAPCYSVIRSSLYTIAGRRCKLDRGEPV